MTPSAHMSTAELAVTVVQPCSSAATVSGAA